MVTVEGYKLVTIVDANGQVTLGKEYAGRLVQIDRTEPGIWIFKIGELIPDSEGWMLQDGVSEKIDRAIAWAEANPPSPTDMDALGRRIRESRTGPPLT